MLSIHGHALSAVLETRLIPHHISHEAIVQYPLSMAYSAMESLLWTSFYYMTS